MKPQLIPAADIDRLDTWQKYRKGLCDTCNAGCCTLPVEVRLDDLIRLGLVDEFERGATQPHRQTLAEGGCGRALSPEKWHFHAQSHEQ